MDSGTASTGNLKVDSGLLIGQFVLFQKRLEYGFQFIEIVKINPDFAQTSPQSLNMIGIPERLSALIFYHFINAVGKIKTTVFRGNEGFVFRNQFAI